MSEEAVRVDPVGPRPGTGATTTRGGGPARNRGGSSVPGLPVPSELVVLALTALLVLIAAAVADNFEAPTAWTLVTVLALGYMLSRGFAKREHRGDHRHD
jgi:hypothetical protein